MDKIAFSLPKVTKKSDDFIRAETAVDIQSPDGDEYHEANSFAGRLDDTGKSFDPLIHSSPPEKTPTGRWKKKPKAKLAKKEQINDIRAEAQKVAFIYAGLHVLVFGESGAIDEDGVVSLTNSYERYMAEKGIVSMPPAIDVALASVIYTAGVVSRPENKPKAKAFLSSAWASIKDQLKKLKTMLTKRKPKL